MSAIHLELPEAVYQRAELLARRNEMTLDRLMLVALIEKLGVAFPDEKLEARAQRGSHNAMNEFLAGVPDVEPEAGDKL